MSIAEKITTIAENVDKVSRSGYKTGYENGFNAGDEYGYGRGYADGKAEGGGVNPLEYATRLNSVFYAAAFPEEYELTLNLPNCTSLEHAFRLSTGLKKVTLKLDTKRTYNAWYAFAGSNASTSTLEEVVLPDGVKFSNADSLISYAVALQRITFINEDGEVVDGPEVGIDLSDSTSNTNFAVSCAKCSELRFKPGTINKSIDIVIPTLSDATVSSIIAGLAKVDSKQTLNLHSSMVNKLTTEQSKAIMDKNWEVI